MREITTEPKFKVGDTVNIPNHWGAEVTAVSKDTDGNVVVQVKWFSAEVGWVNGHWFDEDQVAK